MERLKKIVEYGEIQIIREDDEMISIVVNPYLTDKNDMRTFTFDMFRPTLEEAFDAIELYLFDTTRKPEEYPLSFFDPRLTE